MKDRKLMIEVTDEEYELLKKGIKLSDMKTEDIIYELISRCGSRHIMSKDILSGMPDMAGELSIADGIFEFKFRNTTSPRIGRMPYMTDPLDPISLSLDPLIARTTDEESATTIDSSQTAKSNITIDSSQNAKFYSGGKKPW